MVYNFFRVMIINGDIHDYMITFSKNRYGINPLGNRNDSTDLRNTIMIQWHDFLQELSKDMFNSRYALPKIITGLSPNDGCLCKKEIEKQGLQFPLYRILPLPLEDQKREITEWANTIHAYYILSKMEEL